MPLTMLDSWPRALKYIPNGTQTYSKMPERFIEGVYPKMLISGHGAEVTDENGTKYTDFISSLGAISLGYSHIAVDDTVKDAINNGEVLLSLPHPKEGELAEILCEKIKFIDKVKFFKTGSEATSAAVRVARAYTGKDKILVCGYNGWHDWRAVEYDRPAGIPKDWKSTIGRFKYNDLDSIEDHLDKGDVAAIILEPVIYEEPKDEFLKKLIRLVHSYQGLVIFDEMITGFRFGLGGASEFFHVEPDLVCYGKAIANGYPLAVLAGKKEFMDVFERSDFFVSGTFGGDLIGISAGIATIQNLKPERIWASGMLLKMGFTGLTKDLPGIKCVGYPPRTMFEFDNPKLKALFWQECVKRGVLLGPCNFVTQAHTPYIISMVLNTISQALDVVKANWDSSEEALEGKLPKAVFT